MMVQGSILAALALYQQLTNERVMGIFYENYCEYTDKSGLFQLSLIRQQ